MQCCKTCTERYGRGRLGPLGPLIPNVWTQWSGYGECSRSCGSGIQSRTRQCSGYCLRKQEVETISCNIQKCTVWTQWSAYGKCSRSCGSGIQSRTRQCSGYCLRKEEVQTISCNTQRCPACIDTRPDCLVYATASYCQKRYDYMGMHCCKTCTERYWGRRLVPLGPGVPLIPKGPLGPGAPLIPNVCKDDARTCAQDADKCFNYSEDWTGYMERNCKKTCRYCH